MNPVPWGHTRREKSLVAVTFTRSAFPHAPGIGLATWTIESVVPSTFDTPVPFSQNTMSPFGEYTSRTVAFDREYVPSNEYAASEIATGALVPPRFSSRSVSESEPPGARVLG